MLCLIEPIEGLDREPPDKVSEEEREDEEEGGFRLLKKPGLLVLGRWLRSQEGDEDGEIRSLCKRRAPVLEASALGLGLAAWALVPVVCPVGVGLLAYTVGRE